MSCYDVFNEILSNPNKLSGFYMDKYPELKKNWTLYLEGTVYDFIDKIGGEIDFCIIDIRSWIFLYMH